MQNLSSFLEQTIDKFNFRRTKYFEKNIPTNPDNVVIMPFFGDLRSTFILSSFLFRRIKERDKNYVILLSWPGLSGLFPQADEYWEIMDKKDSNVVASLSGMFYNKSDLYFNINRNLINRFSNVLEMNDLKKYYDSGFTLSFWREFESIKLFLPPVLSSSTLPNDIKVGFTKRQGKKIVVFPARDLESWQQGKLDKIKVSKEFWEFLIKRLLEQGYVPVIYQNSFTYDLSSSFTDECLYLDSPDINVVLSTMKASDCVLDIFSGISRLAIAARAPFLAVDERKRYFTHKEYAIDHLACQTQRQYIFYYSASLLNSNFDSWNTNIINNVLKRIKTMNKTQETSNVNNAEIYKEVSYDGVKEINTKRLGVKFINCKKDK